MDKKTAAKLGGLTAWHRDREGMLLNAEKGGRATLERHGKAHYVRMNEAKKAKREAAA